MHKVLVSREETKPALYALYETTPLYHAGRWSHELKAPKVKEPLKYNPQTHKIR